MNNSENKFTLYFEYIKLIKSLKALGTVCVTILFFQTVLLVLYAENMLSGESVLLTILTISIISWFLVLGLLSQLSKKQKEFLENENPD